MRDIAKRHGVPLGAVVFYLAHSDGIAGTERTLNKPQFHQACRPMQVPSGVFLTISISTASR